MEIGAYSGEYNILDNTVINSLGPIADIISVMVSP